MKFEQRVKRCQRLSCVGAWDRRGGRHGRVPEQRPVSGAQRHERPADRADIHGAVTNHGAADVPVVRTVQRLHPLIRWSDLPQELPVHDADRVDFGVIGGVEDSLVHHHVLGFATDAGLQLPELCAVARAHGGEHGARAEQQDVAGEGEVCGVNESVVSAAPQQRAVAGAQGDYSTTQVV